MQVRVGEHGELIFGQVYNSIVLEIGTENTFAICMRDDGFEFTYNDVWYEAKNGDVHAMGAVTPKLPAFPADIFRGLRDNAS